MWGEDDSNSRRERPSIPSSNFSSEGGRPKRPARRGRQSGGGDSDGGGGGWYDDDEPAFTATRQRPPRSSGGGGWDDDVDWDNDRSRGNSRRSNFGGGRDDDWGDNRYEGRQRRDGGRGRGGGGRGGGRRGGRASSRGRGGREYSRTGRGGRSGRGDDRGEKERKEVRINLKLIESAGYQHLYGISPVLNALKANVRNFANAKEEEEGDLSEFQSRLADSIDDMMDNDDDDFSSVLEGESSSNKSTKEKNIKPEATPSPHLFVQEGTLDNTKRSFRSAAKRDATSEIVTLAKENELPIVEVDKGVLNTLCGNRPHQGFVLRCGSLDFAPVRRLPTADDNNRPTLWLALDEVVDPQNLGEVLLFI